jgi:membrane-bound serine protease (ClpP class)
VQIIKTNRVREKLCLLIIMVLIIFNFCSNAFAVVDAPEKNTDQGEITYMIDINERFSETVVSYVERSLKNAEQDKAGYIIINLHARSQLDNFAKKISDLILSTDIHTICYVNDEAVDGAFLVAMSCDTIMMSPGADMGFVYKDGGEDYDTLVDYWSETFNNVLKQNNRDVTVNMDKVVSNVYADEKNIINEDLIITVSTAIKLGFADKEATSVQTILNDYGLSEGVIIQEEKNFMEKCVDTLSSPVMATILLVIGLGAIMAEIVLSGYGIVGFSGLVCLFLYFLGGYKSGFVDGSLFFILFGSFILFLVEILLSPGNGVCGTVGIIGLLTSIILAAPNVLIAFIQIVMVLTVVVIIIMTNLKDEKKQNIFKRLILRDKTTTEEGYLSQPINIHEYLGKEGVALTALRPAGAVKIGTERVDVVTEGDFISAGDRVVVIKVDGSSVIVRKL